MINLVKFTMQTNMAFYCQLPDKPTAKFALLEFLQLAQRLINCQCLQFGNLFAASNEVNTLFAVTDTKTKVGYLVCYLKSVFMILLEAVIAEKKKIAISVDNYPTLSTTDNIRVIFEAPGRDEREMHFLKAFINLSLYKRFCFCG